jgi:hypothetical protein
VPYYAGAPVPLTFTLTNAAGAPVNAVSTPPVVTVTRPDGTTATPSVTNTGTGIYTATFGTTQAGHHTVAWVCADATYPGGYADEFDVWSLTSTNVLSLADAKATLSIAANNTTYDDLVSKVNASITEWLEWYCGAIVPQTVQETIRVGGLVTQLSKPPVINLVTWTTVPAGLANTTATVAQANSGPMFPVMVYGVAYPLNQLYFEPVKGWVRNTSGLPFYYGPYIWQYQAGYETLPYGIRYAAMVTLRHLYGLERGGAGVAAAGSADAETTETPFGFAVPNRAIEALAPHQSPAAIA